MPFEGNHFAGIMFTVVPIIIAAGFILVFVIIILSAVKGFSKWSYNNSQPELSVFSKVISKRTNVSGSASNNNGSIYTKYFVTFEVESGDRMELQVKGEEYGLLAENDTGKLTFQGTRYLGFKRECSKQA